ncbi:MAG: hypothetical protein K6G55_01490, partial [Selenomonadaceae bacterium]|nr:hypothetical protein [Selenomonadaceae bacterium]
MKNFFTFAIISALMLFLSLTIMFFIEKTDVLDFNSHNLEIKFEQVGDDTLMTWKPLPYPCVYKVTTVSRTTGLADDGKEYHVLKEEETPDPKYIVPRAPIPTYYYISARGLFGEIFRTKTVCDNPNFPKSKQPVTIYHYDK